MGMRWSHNSPEHQIETYIGTWGVRTAEIADVQDLLDRASRLFEVENSGLPDRMAAAIERLGKKQRKLLALKNLLQVMGDGGRLGSAAQSRPARDGERISEAALERMMAASRPQLINGAPFDCVGELDVDPAQLLRKVVSAVIGAGRSDILYAYPDVLAFFRARLPERREVGVEETDALASSPQQLLRVPKL
jgi:hypothetical protein